MWKDDRKLLVEVFVTHDISEEKLQWIQDNDYATFRVNMSWASYDIASDEYNAQFRTVVW